MAQEHSNNEPLFSIIVTCYNDGLYIDEAIKSVKNSTYKNFEIIVVDDCSTDEYTIQRLLDLEQSGNKVIRKKTNTGVGDSRNTGIQHANGKYILTLDGDDLIHDTYLEKSATWLDKGYSIVYCNVKNFGELNSVRIAPEFSLPVILSGNFIAN